MAIEVASLQATLGLDSSAFDKGIGKAKGSMSGLGSSIVKGLGGVAVGALAGAAAGIAAIGSAAVGTAMQVNDASRQMQAQLGLTADEANALGDVALNVFGNNFGGSIQDAASALVEVKTQLKDLPTDQLQTATENAFRLSDAFGTDMSQSLNAVNTLMTEFGLSQQEAFDLLTTGFQQGLDSSGDFLDTIGEYSNLFAESGASASEFFSLMDSGLLGGVLGTDKAADAFKEFSIRIIDGSDTTTEALENIGISSADLFAGISDGSISGVDAFNQVLDALREIDDPLLQNQAGVALLGTQWEDMGASAVLAINTAGTAMEDMAGATDGLNAQYDTLGAAFEGIRRKALVALEPLGQELLNVFNTFRPEIDAALEAITAALENIDLTGFIEMIGGAFATISEAIAPLQGAISTFDGLELSVSGFGLSLGELPAIFEAVSAAIEPWKTALMPVFESLSATFNEFMAGAAPMFAQFWEDLQATWAAAAPVMTDALTRINDAFASIVGQLGMIFANNQDANESLSILQAVLDGVIIGVQGLALAMQALATAFELADLTLQIAVLTFDKIKEAVGAMGAAFDSAKAQLQGLISGLQDLANAPIDAIRDKANAAGSAFGNWASNINPFNKQSPVPLAEGLKEIRKQLNNMTPLGDAFSVGQPGNADPFAPLVSPDFSQQPAAASGPIIVNVHIGERQVEQIISNLQGRRQMNLAALGGQVGL